MKDFDIIVQRIDAAEKWRDTNYAERWRSNYRQYRSVLEVTRTGSNIFVPYTFMICEVIRARLAESLFSERPYVSVLPREEGDRTRADKLSTLLDWQLSERMRVSSIFKDDILQNMVIFGSAVTFTGWRKRTRGITKMEQVDAPLLMDDGLPLLDEYGTPKTFTDRQPQSVDVVVYDDPVLQSIDLFDFFVDPTASDIDDARYCGHREYLTRGDLESVDKYKIDWSKLSPETNIEDGRKERLEQQGRTMDGENYDREDKGGKYLVHHYWEDDRHVVIINGQQAALDERNPFWHGMKPYDKCCYSPLANNFFGVGIPEMLASLQDELNTVRNQRIDYNSMALRRMFKVKKGCGLTGKDLIWRQNGVLQVENMDDVQEIQIAPLPASAFSNEAMIKQDMRDVTGCHDIIMGLANADETATTTMTKDNNASVRFKDVVSAACLRLLVPVSEKCIALDQQFLTEERAVRLLDEGAQEIFYISPWELDGNYDIIYVGSAVEPAANKQMEKQRAVDAYAQLAGNPLYQQDMGAMQKLIEYLLTSLGVTDTEGMIPQMPAPVQPMQQEQPGAVAFGSGNSPADLSQTFANVMGGMA